MILKAHTSLRTKTENAIGSLIRHFWEKKSQTNKRGQFEKFTTERYVQEMMIRHVIIISKKNAHTKLRENSDDILEVWNVQISVRMTEMSSNRCPNSSPTPQNNSPITTPPCFGGGSNHNHPPPPLWQLPSFLLILYIVLKLKLGIVLWKCKELVKVYEIILRKNNIWIKQLGKSWFHTPIVFKLDIYPNTYT